MSLLFASDLPPAEHAQWRAELAAALPEERFVTAPGPDVDVALVANPPPGSLAGLGGLKLIQSLWAGVDRLLADATLPPGVPIARMIDPAMSEAMAETALWAVLSVHRDTFVYARQQREAVWRQHSQRRADEVAVVVLGLGAMGRRAAAALMRQGYEMLGWSTRPAQVDGMACRHGDAGLADVLARADVVVNLLPLTAATRGLFCTATFAGMRRGAGLVNLARGAHVVEADLLAALDGGRLAQAVLDVFPEEPLPAGHPYWTHPRITVLPHVAAQTDLRSAAAIAAANVRRLRAGDPLQGLVDRSRGY